MTLEADAFPAKLAEENSGLDHSLAEALLSKDITNMCMDITNICLKLLVGGHLFVMLCIRCVTVLT